MTLSKFFILDEVGPFLSGVMAHAMTPLFLPTTLKTELLFLAVMAHAMTENLDDHALFLPTILKTELLCLTIVFQQTTPTNHP